MDKEIARGVFERRAALSADYGTYQDKYVFGLMRDEYGALLEKSS